jgi:hypothetical protein
VLSITSAKTSKNFEVTLVPKTFEIRAIDSSPELFMAPKMKKTNLCLIAIKICDARARDTAACTVQKGNKHEQLKLINTIVVCLSWIDASVCYVVTAASCRCLSVCRRNRHHGWRAGTDVQ